MSENPRKDKLLDHNYDGIQEFDNPMPRWWVYLFWASIAFSAFYLLFYHAGPGKLVIEAYNEDMVAYYDLQAEQFVAMGDVTEGTLHELMADEPMMAGAGQLFVSKCALCHGNDGEGNIGPNLTDDYWLHGGNLTDIFHTVSEGVTAKGMLAWKNQLRPAELLSVSAYVGTLRGTTPDNAKAPQGELQPYTFVPESDSDAGDGAGVEGEAAAEDASTATGA